MEFSFEHPMMRDIFIRKKDEYMMMRDIEHMLIELVDALENDIRVQSVCGNTLVTRKSVNQNKMCE